MDNIPHNSTVFESKEKHILFAEAYAELGANVKEACEKVGIDRKTFYNWRRIPGFEEWLSEYVRQFVLRSWGSWYAIAKKYAAKGSYQHLQLLFQLADKFIPTVKIIEELDDGKLLELAQRKGVRIPERIGRFLKYGDNN